MSGLSFIRSCTLILVLLFLAAPGCIEDSSDGVSKTTMRAYCRDEGGDVSWSHDADGKAIEICTYTRSVSFDEAKETLTYECDLELFYNGECDDGTGEDAYYEPEPLTTACPTCAKSVREMFYDQVEDVMTKLDNTGYTHRPFDLHPDYDKLADQTEDDPIDTYNVFTDCSGYVGYYVIQGIAPELYAKLPRRYSCGPLDANSNSTSTVARPLAADFYDHFKNATAYSSNSTEATNSTDACWARVDHISDAFPGDVIVYAHPDNLDMDTQYCCNSTDNVYSSHLMSSDSTCDDGRIVYKAVKDDNGNTKNTGHVLFIHGYAYRSTEKKDDDGDYQWVVEVSDSTTSPHMFDSRDIGEGESSYESNTYHAWTKGDGTVSRCADGEYHRSCTDTDVEIEINTNGNHATGIGVGKMYINDGMDGYRTSYSHSTHDGTIMIGRPVACE